MLLLAIRYYAKKLTPGAWKELNPPRREGSRKLNSTWLAHLWAARRLLCIPARKGEKSCSYKLAANYTNSEPIHRYEFYEFLYGSLLHAPAWQPAEAPVGADINLNRA
jgi:hypothetical protein